MEVSKKRHIAKTITWRVIASVTTFILAYVFFREDPEAITKASGVAIAESFIKMLLYYFHERFWYKSDFGIKDRNLKDGE
ncbi:hypothetical protein CW736_00665 [Nonlabens sp. MB-3u-79]|jgi:uncharacterized membrane protein|uniref:DUF2061 domain-containing protein n=1 Tax=Nonlabens sp. MB-3u-79 TaxID=2058134 RepID=UPI000C304E1B|nr:DUF2061 domain-containing protein [Nonlabens sp. MB-3u-79]AUC78014.1 hypothetical protein CW736_00665 [Nonlabens sp. MB-3u-79]|tara:strand:+ start:29655 stop:29894 length:240 start_codon:yes stop_codon:yes gene_type:complete